MHKRISPKPGFLESLREETERCGILLISDQVMSFRLSYHGAMHLRPLRRMLQNVSPAAAPVLSGHAVHQYPAVLGYRTVSETVPRTHFQGVKHLFVLNLEHF